MPYRGSRLFQFLGLAPQDLGGHRKFAASAGLALERLRYYDQENKLPLGQDLAAILAAAGECEDSLRRHLGRTRFGATEGSPGEVRPTESSPQNESAPAPTFVTERGVLYQEDCLAVLPAIPDESVDLAFADPPFNLRKLYPSQIDDDLGEVDYIRWCEEWIEHTARILKWGGSFFLWNLPRWNTILSGVLERHLTFRHWIAVDIKYTLPLPGRLYPSHYSLLYYCKGPKPAFFAPDRLPMQICPKCMTDLRDYGGYKSRMNPRGVNLTDVWYDLSPVRHRKRKRREGANELPILLLDRVLEMASRENDTVLDPFGGSGTTFAAAEIKGRKWIGMEIGPLDDIIGRLSDLREERQYVASSREELNCLFRREHRARREQLGLWTDGTFR